MMNHNLVTNRAWTGRDVFEHGIKDLARHDRPRSYELQLELGDSIPDELIDNIIGELRRLEDRLEEYERRFLSIRQELEF
jgi:hypothetical protein